MSARATLAERLKAEIATGGPIGVAQFMTRCLHDPLDGYYATRPALGAGGDFLTAPLVSQMFGELIGLWMAETWVRMGRPGRVRLVELGPGDATLMSDALRAARLAPDFLAALDLTLVETSRPLIALQKERLATAPLPVSWAARLGEVADGAPVILVANEFLDCLGADQFVRDQTGVWRERRVGLDADGALSIGLAPAWPPGPLPLDAPLGQVWEISVAQEALGRELASLIELRGGAALLIDYGRDAPGPGDTLQALKAHQKVDPLAAPGEADLTVWADFPAVLRAAGGRDVRTTAILPQGEFLRRLGVHERAAALARARPDRAETVARQLARLVEPDQMGSLFKACAIHAPDFQPPGFEELP